MAPADRDVAGELSPTEGIQPHSRRNMSMARSDKPVFTTLHTRERITFGKKERDVDENVPPGGGSGRGNWMSGKGMRLGEAFQRTEADGNISQHGVHPAIGSASRIPRTKSFSPSPSNRVRRTQNLQGKDRRSLSVPLDSESESTGPILGSPSPGARNRQPRREDTGSDISQVFARGMRQYHDDRERHGALRSYDSPPLFAKARVGPKVEETTRTLAEKTSVGSFEAEPPVRVPKSWGSRANKNSGWMAKILSPDHSLEVKDHPEDGPSSERRKSPADIPLPSVEDLSSMQTLTPPASRPASTRPINMSPEKSQIWNADLDFTAQSLQMSPQLRVKPTMIDDLRLREIENLSARGVATNRLEEIREKISEEQLIAEEAERLTVKERESKAAHQWSGEHEERGPASNEAGGAAHPEEHDETWETLRALSRVLTSKSPSPSRTDGKDENIPPANAGSSAEEKLGERQAAAKRDFSLKSNTNDTNSDSKRSTGTSTPPKSDVDPEERITAEARLFELQDNRSERNSIRVPSRSPSPPDVREFEETPRPKPDPLSLPTPRVTGAFIETPAPTSRKPRKSRSTPPFPKEAGSANEAASSSGRAVSDTLVTTGNTQRRQPRHSRYRSLVNSAKPTTVAEDLQRIKLEAQLDDSTLEDFDAVLDTHTLEALESENNNTTILEPVLDLQYDERGLPLSAKEKARRLELLTLDRMSQSIRNTSSSIRDARHGIERLEHQVSSSSIGSKEKGDASQYMWIPVPRLVVSNPVKRSGMMSRNWKFTWFGFIVTIFFSWLVSETIICSEFCHVSQSMNPVRSMHTDPYFPLAIPTKLDQWAGKVASNLFWDAWVGLGGERPSIFGKPQPCPWWLGRDGPIGIVKDENYDGRSIFSDEMI